MGLQSTIYIVESWTPALVVLITTQLYVNTISSDVVFLSRTEEPVKGGTCARDRRALQQLALNEHVKHSDLSSDDAVAMSSAN